MEPTAPEVTLRVFPNDRPCMLAHASVNFIATSRPDGKVDVYSYKGDHVRVIEEHTEEVWDIVHLYADILVSVDHAGCIVSWNAATGEILGKFQGASHMSTLSTAGSDTLVLGSTKSTVHLIKHENGKNMKEIRRFWNKDSANAAAAGHIFITHIPKKDLHVWDCANGKCVATLLYGGTAESTFIDENFIIPYSNEMCYIHKNAPGYPLIKAVDLKRAVGGSNTAVIASITAIDSNTLMVTLEKGGVHFISIERVARACGFFPPANLKLIDTLILSDGRLCVIGGINYCTIFPAHHRVKASIEKFAEKMKEGTGSQGPTQNSCANEVTNLNAKLTAQKMETEKAKAELAALKIEMNRMRAELVARNEVIITNGASLHCGTVLQPAALRDEMAAIRAELSARNEATTEIKAAFEDHKLAMEKKLEIQKMQAEEAKANLEVLRIKAEEMEKKCDAKILELKAEFMSEKGARVKEEPERVVMINQTSQDRSISKKRKK